MMENALYYTFSTAAQTVAGAVALLGAFVLYRAQLLGQELEHFASAVKTRSKVDPSVSYELASATIKGRYEKVLSLSEMHHEGLASAELSASRERLQDLLSRRRSLRFSFIASLILSLGLVTGSLIVLSVTPALAETSYASPVLLVGVLWFVLCIVSYYVLLVRHLR